MSHCGRSSVDRAPAPGHPTRKERELFIDASMWKKLTRPVNQHMYSKWSKEPVIEDRCRKTSQVRTLPCVKSLARLQKANNTYGTIWLVRRYFEHRRLLVQIQLCVNVVVQWLVHPPSEGRFGFNSRRLDFP